MASAAATDERQPGIRRPLQRRLGGHVAGQHVRQSGLAGDGQDAVQAAATDVAVDEQGAVADTGERQRQVRRDERLAVAPAGAGDAHEQRTGPVRVCHVQPHAAQRLDDARGTLLPTAVAPLDVRHDPENGEPHRLGDLMGVSQFRVSPIEPQRREQAGAEARDEREEHERRGQVIQGAERRGGGVEYPQVWNAAHFREAGLGIALLDVRRQLFREGEIQPGCAHTELRTAMCEIRLRHSFCGWQLPAIRRLRKRPGDNGLEDLGCQRSPSGYRNGRTRRRHDPGKDAEDAVAKWPSLPHLCGCGLKCA